ncbi:MAG TPA: hypothetical protein VHV83_16515, partial [Armatimonadota bacterium]|nr:hypothetical protein [Armatimonadota bacterium]
DLFDYSWIGTETREPESVEAGRRPQTSASWIQGWMNAVSQGKCGGAWYDPIDTAPATFLEQARQSIIGGAEESLLHCYDYLATKTPGLAIHGKDREIQYGLADAEAFRHECDSLQWLAETLATMTPYGVAVPKQPNADPTTELFLPSFVGMLGIPAIAAASLADRGSAFLGAQAATFPKVISFIETALTDNRPLVVTAHLLAALENGHQLPENAFWQKLSAVGRTAADGGHTAADGGHTASLTDVTPGIAVLSCPEDLWQLMELDQGELDRFRNALLKPFGIEFFAPARVSLHLFASEDRHGEIVENFTDTPVTVTLRFATQNSRQRRCKLAVPTRESATLVNNDDSTYSLYLAPRSMALLLTE